MLRIFVAFLCLRFAVATVRPASSSQDDSDRSPYATARNFTSYAMRLREQEISGVPPLGEPTTLRPTRQHYPWKTNVVTTFFWVGAKQNAGKMSRKHESVW